MGRSWRLAISNLLFHDTSFQIKRGEDENAKWGEKLLAANEFILSKRWCNLIILTSYADPTTSAFRARRTQDVLAAANFDPGAARNVDVAAVFSQGWIGLKKHRKMSSFPFGQHEMKYLRVDPVLVPGLDPASLPSRERHPGQRPRGQRRRWGAWTCCLLIKMDLMLFVGATSPFILIVKA
jgi:hypothetical protein